MTPDGIHAPDDLHPEDANLLRAVRFEGPDRIPMTFHVNDSCWRRYPQDALQEMMADHPLLFPDFEPFPDRHVPDFAPNARADEPFIDPWGCVWRTTEDGIVGIVTEHPLSDWAALDDFVPPDPALGDGLRDSLDSSIRRATGRGRLARGGLRHGHTFLQLCDIRGYENVVFDMADGEPRLERLLEWIDAFNLTLVTRDIAAGVRWMEYPDDLGMQSGPLLTPEQFRAHILPSYRRLMAPARDAGCVVHVHSDGDIRSLVDSLLECGPDVLNLQDRVNGLDWIAARLKGRVCIDLDIDRQKITVEGTPRDIDAWIRRAVETLGSIEGGLTLIYGLYPGVPLPNVRAVMHAMERYAGFFRNG